MKLLPSAICVLFVTLLTLSQAYAETRYVSDTLVVTVRSHKGDKYQTLETLLTAAPVEILEEDKTYVKVKTEKGNVGFIRKQYITKKLPKTIQIKRLQTELEKVKQTLEQTRQASRQSLESADQQNQQIENLTNQLGRTSQELETVTANYQQLLSDSENVLNLSSENEQLIEQNNQMNSELQVLREENQSFHRSNMIQWFLAGAGVFFGGWIIGKISRKKTRSYSRL